MMMKKVKDFQLEVKKKKKMQREKKNGIVTVSSMLEVFLRVVKWWSL